MPASQNSWQGPPARPGGGTSVQCSILQSLEAKSGATAAVADGEGNMWVAGGVGVVTVRKPQSGEVVGSVSYDSEGTKVTHMEHCEGHVWVVSADGRACVFEVATKTQTASVIISAEPITSMTTHGSTIYATTASSVKLYEGTTGRALRWWPVASPTAITAVSSTRIVTGHASGSLKHWDNSGNLISEVEAHTSEVTSIIRATIPTRVGASLITAGADSTIRIWDGAEPQSPSAELRGHSAPVKSLINLSNSLLASCSLDGRIVLWDLQALKSIGALDQHTQPLINLIPAQSMLNTVMWSFGKDSSLTVWGLRHTVPDFGKFEEMAQELVKKDRMLRAAHEELEKSEQSHSKPSRSASAPAPPIANDLLTALNHLSTVNPCSSPSTGSSPFTRLSKGSLAARDVPSEWGVTPQTVSSLQHALLDKWEALKSVEDIHVDYGCRNGPLESVVASLRTELDKANEKVARLTTSTVSHLNSRIEDLMAQVQTKDQELRDTSMSLAKARNTEEGLQAALQQKVAQINKMLAVQKQLTVDLENRDVEVQKLQNKLREVSDMSQAQEEISRLQGAKSLAEEEMKKYQQENEELVLLLDKYRQPAGMVPRHMAAPTPVQAPVPAPSREPSHQSEASVPVVETVGETLIRLQQTGLIQDFKKLLELDVPPPPPPTYLPPPDLTIDQMIRKCDAQGSLQELYDKVTSIFGPVPSLDITPERLSDLEDELGTTRGALAEAEGALNESRARLQSTEALLAENETVLRAQQAELRDYTLGLKERESQLSILKQKLESTASELDMQKDRRHQLEEALQSERAGQNDLVHECRNKDDQCNKLSSELQHLKDTLSMHSSSSTEKEAALHAARGRGMELEQTVAMLEKTIASQDAAQSQVGRVLGGLLAVVQELKQLTSVEGVDVSESSDLNETIGDVVSTLRLVAANLQARDSSRSEMQKDAAALYHLVEDELKRMAPDAVQAGPVPPSEQQQHRLVSTTTANMRLLLQAWHRTEQDVARQTDLMSEELTTTKQQLSQLEVESEYASQSQNMQRQPTPTHSTRSLQTPSFIGRGNDDMALLRQSLEAKSKDYNALQQDMLANRQRMEEKHKRIQALQELTDDRSRIIQEERHKNYQLQREIQYLKREGKRRSEKELEERLAEAEDALSRGSSKAEDMVTALQKKLSDVEKTLEDAQTNAPELKRKLEIAEQRLAESQEQIQLQQELLASQSDTYDEDQTHMQDMEDKVQDLEDKVRDLEDEVSRLRKALKDSQSAQREGECKVSEVSSVNEQLKLSLRDVKSKLEYSEELHSKRDASSRQGSGSEASTCPGVGPNAVSLGAPATGSIIKEMEKRENKAWLSPSPVDRPVPSMSPPESRPSLSVVDQRKESKYLARDVPDAAARPERVEVERHDVAKPPLVKQPALPPQHKLAINKPTPRSGHAPPPQYAFPPQSAAVPVRSESANTGRTLSPVEQRRVQAGLMVASPSAQRRGSGKSTASDKTSSSYKSGQSRQRVQPVVVSATIPSPERAGRKRLTPSSPSSSLSSSALVLSGTPTSSPKRIGRDLTNFQHQLQPRKTHGVHGHAMGQQTYRR